MAEKTTISMTTEMMESVTEIQEKTGQSRSGVIQMLISAGIEQVKPIFFGNEVENKALGMFERFEAMIENLMSVEEKEIEE